jgi:hypothetical protein
MPLKGVPKPHFLYQLLDSVMRVVDDDDEGE